MYDLGFFSIIFLIICPLFFLTGSILFRVRATRMVTDNDRDAAQRERDKRSSVVWMRIGIALMILSILLIVIMLLQPIRYLT
jgi:heme/copper-type cytochrome/quinol oxidase subunit 2